jgi:uncharacterized integral membrane protein
MRFFYFLILIVLLGAVGLFAYQNGESVNLVYWFNRSVTVPLSLLIGVSYVAGMLSGWSVVGMFRRTWRRAMEPPLDTKMR